MKLKWHPTRCPGEFEIILPEIVCLVRDVKCPRNESPVPRIQIRIYRSTAHLSSPSMPVGEDRWHEGTLAEGLDIGEKLCIEPLSPG